MTLPLSSLRFLHSRRLRLVLWWALGLFAAYVLIGFLVLPPVVKYVLETRLGEALHRKVSVERVATNPLIRSVEVSGLAVEGAEGQEMLGFDRLYLDAEFFSSLVKGGPVIREVRLEGPRLRVTRVSPERYDISDLIDEWSKPSDSPTPHFAVSNIQVTGGQVTFIDQPKKVTHTVSDLALNLPFVSSLPYATDIFVEPHFSAKINGAPLVLNGRSKLFAESRESELSLDLDKVELARYLPYSPVRLPFDLKSGSLDTELKLVFRQDKGQPATLKLVGNLHLNNLALADTGGQPLLAWKRLDLAVREADLLQKRFLLDSVHLVGLDARARIGSDGKLNWMDMADRLAVGGESAGQSAPVTWSVGEIQLEDGALRYQDQRLAGQPVQVIDRLDVKIAGLSSTPDSKLAVTLAARANDAGSLKAGGEVRLRPLAANLDVEASGLPLLPFQPYFSERLNNVDLVQGQLSGQGTLDLRVENGSLGGGFKGQLTVGDLKTVNKARRSDFLKWKSLFIGDIDARLQPLALSVGEVALSDFYARAVVTSEGRLNLLDVVRKSNEEPGGTRQEAVPIRIGKVSLQGGTVNFSDYFIKPNYTANLTRIGGRVSGLSSEPNSVAELELRGNYGAAPVEILAKLNPFAAKAYLDLKGEVRGVDLTSLSAYSGKYAGYAIDEGKLSLFVTYHLENNQLAANNRVFLDQLTFGEPVDSPTATTLPVKFAIALLKNSRGEIDVNLPIGGSIDDPEFSLGGIVLRVIGNLFVKAVTSPFALLGSVFGGGEELSSLEFAPGRATLDAAAIKRLEALAKAMNDRPALKLEIAGRADPESDRDGLKRVAVERAAKAEKLKDQNKGAEAGSSLGSVELTAQEYPIYLRRAYKEAKFPKPRTVIGLQKDLPVEDMEKLMLANLPVGEEELRRLAARRAEAAQAWLAEQGKLPVERLYLVAPKIGKADSDDKASPSRVDFSLR